MSLSLKLRPPRPLVLPPVVAHAEPPAEPEPSRLGTVVGVVGAGLLVQGAGDALARAGHERFVLALILIGLVTIFAPCAWRLVGSGAGRNERIGTVLVLGLGLLASYLLRSPLILDGFDELGHGATLVRLLEGRSLFVTNTGLPISPFYPGLELLTAAVKWLTGLPLVLDQVVVLAAARIVLVLSIFLVVERVTGSARAGGIGVLVYAANPEFYSFDAQYAYETLALAFAAGVVYLLLHAVDVDRPRSGPTLALAVGGMGALVVTHHLTSWLTVAFLVVGATGLLFRSRSVRAGGRPGEDRPSPGVRPARARERLGPALERWGLRLRLYPAPTVRARMVGLVAAVGLALGGIWTAVVGSHLTGYVDPIFATAADDIGSALGHLHGNRRLFHNAAGGGSPGWEIALMLAAAALWCLILLVSLYHVVFRRSVRGGPFRYVPALIAVVYPLALLTSVSASSKEVGGRAVTFIFFGMAVVVGGWLSSRPAPASSSVSLAFIVVVASVCFLGSTLFGGGPLPSYVPGPYLVGADERSVSAPSIAVARWAAANLPVDAHVAADRDNGELLDDLGRVDPVTAIGGLDNPAPIFFDPQFNPFDQLLIRQADIRYIVVDTRLTRGPPLYGVYIAEGESQGSVRLTSAELGKIAAVPGVRRIYDNGAIQVYDLSSVLGRPALPVAGATGNTAATALDPPVLILASLVALVWGIRLWRRRRSPPTLHRALVGLVAAMVVGLFGAGVVLLVHLPPGLVTVAALVVLAGLGLRPAGGRRPSLVPASHRLLRWMGNRASARAEVDPHRPRPVRPAHPRRRQLALGCVGLALFGLATSLAVASARREWVPPPELSVVTRPGGLEVAGVQLGSAGPRPSKLEVVAGNQVVWSVPLRTVGAPQHVVVPRPVVRPGTRLVLVAGGRPIRQVGG